MSTTTSRFQPALLGGLLIGALSSIPLVNLANICCCLWVVVGGVLTCYLLQQNTEQPLEVGDAVLSGLLAGLIGAVITCIVNWAMMAFSGPMITEQLQRALNDSNIPPEVRDFLLKLVSGPGLAIVQLLVALPLFAVFSMLGSLLGLAFFKKKPPQVTPSA